MKHPRLGPGRQMEAFESGLTDPTVESSLFGIPNLNGDGGDATLEKGKLLFTYLEGFPSDCVENSSSD